MRTRRDFFKKALSGAIALTGAPALYAKTQKETSLFRNAKKEKDATDFPAKISIFSYSFRGEFEAGRMNAFGFLESCKYRYGIQAADFWSGSFPGAADVDLEWIKILKTALDDRQLVVPNIAVDGAHLITSPAESRELHEKRQNKFLEAAKILGARFVRLDANTHSDTALKDKEGHYIWTEKEFDYLVKRYRQIAQYAYDNGFQAGAENHMCASREWKNIEKLYKAVDHPGFAICNHLGGWTGTPEEVDFADKASVPFTAHTHIAWNICEGELVEKIKHLWQGGYQGYYNVEHHSGQNEYNLVGVQLAKVKSVLADLSKGGDGILYKKS